MFYLFSFSLASKRNFFNTTEKLSQKSTNKIISLLGEASDKFFRFFFIFFLQAFVEFWAEDPGYFKIKNQMSSQT